MTFSLSRMMKQFGVQLWILILLSAAASVHAAAGPRLNFSDLVNGPDVGLGDGQGSGAVVTIWGQHLGDVQAGSTIYFRDSAGVVRQPHVYYWKRADGQLPAGPADLYSSHKMQEIAISIPDSALGEGEIYVRVGGIESNSLAFTVRTGQIYHVKSSGNDSNNGSWSSPWRTVNGAGENLTAKGSIVYVHDVNTGSPTAGRGLYWSNNANAGGSGENNQAGIVAFPNHHPTVKGIQATGFYNGPTAIVVSKFTARASNYTGQTANGQPTGYIGKETRALETTANGRTIGNNMSDIEGGCASNQNGGLQGNSRYEDRVSNVKVFGNEIFDYGCQGSNKLHHTTYFSIRSGSDNEQIPAPEVGWNYLHDNWAKNGIHFFDQGIDATDYCGNFTTPLRIHNNVIVNQGGAGIALGSSSCLTWNVEGHIYNNVIINSGYPTTWDGVDPGTSSGPSMSGILLGDNNNDQFSPGSAANNNTIHVYNNTIIGWELLEDTVRKGSCIATVGSADNLVAEFSDNVCSTSLDRHFAGWFNTGIGKQDGLSGTNNVFHYSGSGAPSEATVPGWASSSLQIAPQLQVDGAYIIVSDTSPILSAASRRVDFDVYGNPRAAATAIGAVSSSDVTLLAAPNPPLSLSYEILPVN